MNSMKTLLMLMMFMSTMLTISSTNWMGMWMGMEMNLMAFIPYMTVMKNKKSSKAIMIYFMVQSMGSMIMLFGILMNSFITISYLMEKEIVMMTIMLGLILKMGAAPLHFWMVEMAQHMNWSSLMILMSWQKIAPMYVLSNMITMNLFTVIIIIMSAMVGAIGGINNTNLQKIMTFSSINHMSWMLLMMINKTQWMMYLMIYSIMVIMACSFFKKFKANYLNQLNIIPMSMMEKYTLASILLSMGGLPPFLGFLPKWMVIESMINSNLMILITLLMMLSLITLFYYMRMVSSLLMMFNANNKWMVINKNNISMIFIINCSLPLFSSISFF
uniref:NADH-ubiquinone oxidoreductase chain 2 n=1 Tax=Metatropis brevirostris TaxID=2813418 RepID=A0A8T9ZX05_9HEMI|nr:NADH dehydrogenase subunit 2 [Metatropis brevirostris]